MWGKPPFTIAENCVVDVRNLVTACEWYKEKLGFRKVDNNREDDSGRPFTDLSISNDDTFLSLVELEPGAIAEKRHVIFYAKNLEKAYQWLADRGVAVEPTTTDSGGNRLFRFQDLVFCPGSSWDFSLGGGGFSRRVSRGERLGLQP